MVLEYYWTRSGEKESIGQTPSTKRAIATSITANKQRALLMSVYFHHSGFAEHHVAIEKHRKSKKSIQIVGGDFNAELGPGIGVERVSVGTHTLKEENKRGDWMKQWLMMQNFVALNTMYRKTPEKTSYIQDTERCRETAGLHFGRQETLALQ